MTKIIVLVLASLTIVGCAADNGRRLRWLLERLRLEGWPVLFGDRLVLDADGIAHGETVGDGTWEGDAYSVTIKIEGVRATGVSCRRPSVEESKQE
jgi:hypothetical protein